MGQAASYTFSGTAGQNLTLSIRGDTFLGSTNIYVYQPNGAQLNAISVNYTSGAGTVSTLPLYALPTTGNYSVRVVPSNGNLGAISLSILSELTGAFSVNGALQSLSMATGQNARYTFTASAGKHYGLVFKNFATTPTGKSLNISVLDPGASAIASCVVTANVVCDTPSLATSGTYTVLIRSWDGAATVSAAVVSDVDGTLTMNANSATVKPFVAGQNVLLTFNNATAGTTARLNVSGLSMTPAGSKAFLKVLDPSGSNVFGNTYYIFTDSGYPLELPTLGSVGNYTVVFDPQGFAAGSASFAVNSTTQQSLAIDGAAVSVPWAANQQPTIDFTTTVANQAVSFVYTDMTTNPSGGTLAYTLSDSTWWTTTFGAPGTVLPQFPLENVGVHTMALVPQGSFSGAVKVAVVNDALGTLTIGGAAGTHTPTKIGQSKRFTFTNSTASRSSQISINSSAWASGNWWLLSPSGGATIGSFTNKAVTYSTTLLDTGTYTLILVPSIAASGAVSVSVK